jgi:hypothetical protein
MTQRPKFFRPGRRSRWAAGESKEGCGGFDLEEAFEKGEGQGDESQGRCPKCDGFDDANVPRDQVMADTFEFILGLPHFLPQREAVSHQLFYRRVDGLHCG